MQQIRSGADLATQLLEQTVGLLDALRQVGSFLLCALPQVGKTHREYRENLPGAVVQLARDVAALLILSAQKLPGKLAQLFGLFQYLGIALFEFAGAREDLGFEGFGKRAETLFALAQSFCRAFLIMNV